MSLIHSIEACLKATAIPPSRFGRESVRDPRLVHDLRRGRQPGPRMERRVRAHIAIVMAAHLAGASAPAGDER
jgi:hypothetical protein